MYYIFLYRLFLFYIYYILIQIQSILNINYLQLILTYYNVLDNSINIKKLSDHIIKELEFIIFILNKQKNINFKIDSNVWNQMRGKCLIHKTKTKMPRESISLSEIMFNINNTISLNK